MFTSLMKNGEVPLLLKKEKGGNGGGEGGREETQLRLRNVCSIISLDEWVLKFEND